MNILLIGSGGREHALAWALKKSKNLSALYCAPGNPGIEQVAECVNIAADAHNALIKFAKEKNIDLVFIGPEAPLVDGLADTMKMAGLKVFGPSAKAAQLEGSKGFMKDFCARHKIPTAAYGRFKKIEDTEKFIHAQTLPIVIKTDGLAAGKGVIICPTYNAALVEARAMLSGASFGKAGTEIVVEKFLDGEELSYFALSDGKTMLPFGSAQDHKRAFNGDKGPNTGGMGAYSPAHLMTPELEQKILKRLIQPTIDGMAKDGNPFTGVLFAGIMVVKSEPFLIEYNIRFGDPECQALMMRLESNLAEILLAGAEGTLEKIKDKVKWSDDTALCVIMAANGYPGAYTKNTRIKNLDEADRVENVTIFHAGTSRNSAGHLIATGGRVLGVTAHGSSARTAQTQAYKAVDKINWDGGFCRRDIGWRAVKAS
ncbi:MAG: phosphoribosylamine--glycine ligase [Alphaproteobacteria bacterium]